MYDEIEKHKLICPECGLKIYVIAKIQRGYSDHEDVTCPECNYFVQNIRADWGFDIIKTEK